jgi:hypothetical protein
MYTNVCVCINTCVFDKHRFCQKFTRATYTLINNTHTHTRTHSLSHTHQVVSRRAGGERLPLKISSSDARGDLSVDEEEEEQYLSCDEFRTNGVC